MIKRRVKRSALESIVHVLIITIFIVYAITLLFPLFWAVLSSLKEHNEYMTNPPFALPELWLLGNYVEAFNVLEVNEISLFGMIGNSLWYAAGSCILNVFVCSMTAYIFARYPFKGSKTIYAVMLIVMLMPIIGSGPATYRLYSRFGWINSPLFLVSMAGGIGINFLFLEGFYRNVSWNYAEAAFIDGANHWQVYFKIMFPQALSMVSILLIMQFIQYWNDYSTPMLYFKSLPTLSLGLYMYEKKMIRNADMPIYFAGLIISVIPVLIIFGIFQNSIMERVDTGGLKG